MATNSRTIALVMKALTNPFYTKLDQGAREYSAKHNIPLQIFGLDRETDIDHQINIIDDLISRGYGAIIIAPADSKKLIPVCKKALDKGIKVINIDNPLDKQALEKLGISIPFIGPDNFAGGELVGTHMRDKLQGKGRVLLIEGIPGVSNSDKRKNGFITGITRDSTIEIARIAQGNWHKEEAFSVVMEALEKPGRIDAIFCTNDVMALGAVLALDLKENMSQVFVAGYDNIELVRHEMAIGRIHATIEQHPEIMGAYGVRAAWQNLNGHSLPDEQLTPINLITSEHIGKTLTFSISTTNNPFFSTLVTSALEEAELFGMRLTLLDAQNQDAKQLVDIVTALENKPDILVINPTNSATVLPVLETAESLDVPVITVDRRISGGNVLCHIASDNKAGGKMAAEFIARRLKGTGKLLELEGIPGTSAAHNRGTGFNETIGQYDNISVAYREAAGFDRQRAKTITKSLLTRKVEIDGVFAHNDNMILGLLDAYQEADRPLPRVLVGFDGIDEAVKAVREGKLSGTIAQRPELMGKLVVHTAAKYFRKEHLPREVHVDLKLVTQEE